jgi:hypothetical protein
VPFSQLVKRAPQPAPSGKIVKQLPVVQAVSVQVQNRPAVQSP